MPVDVVVGLQRGDEGKGRFVDMMMPDYDIGARFNGGNNAGHKVVLPDGTVYALHGLPTSIVHEGAMSVVGNGTVIDPRQLVGEMATLASQGIDISPEKLLISGGTHLTLPSHINGDIKREKGAEAQGSTKSGIAEVYAAKARRSGVRAELINNDPGRLFEVAFAELRTQRCWLGRNARLGWRRDKETAEKFVDAAKLLGQYVTDTALYLNRQLRQPDPARVLAEGAQAFLLDIDHGMYPFTTSSPTTAGGVSTGLGVPPSFIERITGIIKAVPSHVGGGPFVTGITDAGLLEQLHGDLSAVDAEKGTTTGRLRRLGHLDLPQIRRALMVNGQESEQSIALTKLDWVPRYGDEVKICTAYFRKGKLLKVAPDAGYKLEESTPVYVTLPAWKEDIQSVRKFEDLPEKAQSYVHFLEHNTGVPIKMIGVGPGRDQVIVR